MFQFGEQMDARQPSRVQVRVHKAQQLQKVLQDRGPVQETHEDLRDQGLPDQVCHAVQTGH